MNLKQLNKKIRKAQDALYFYRMLAKGEPTPQVEQLQNRVNELRAAIVKLTDPKNAVRCSLPKKQQRKLGLLPQV
jgi:ribosomal protein S6